MLLLIVAALATISWAQTAGEAAPEGMQLVDEVLSIDARAVHSISINLHQQPAVIDFSYEVSSGGDISITLIARTQAGDRFLRRIPRGDGGSFRQAAPDPGDYELVFDNRRNQDPAQVHVHVDLDFDAAGLKEPATLSPVRRGVVTGLSLLFLVGLTVWFARRVGPAIEQRRRGPPRLPY